MYILAASVFAGLAIYSIVEDLVPTIVVPACLLSAGICLIVNAYNESYRPFD